MSSGQYSLEEEMIEGPKCRKPCPYRDERVPITREKVVTELDYRPVRTPVYTATPITTAYTTTATPIVRNCGQRQYIDNNTCHRCKSNAMLVDVMGSEDNNSVIVQGGAFIIF
jgi:hypothetical protein